MATTAQIPELVRQKLAAFEKIQDEFEQCFHFGQQVHGQKRFSTFPVEKIVYYFHSLWLCECKDRLLSIYKNIRRYEGRHCLELLRTWQGGSSAEVVTFLVRKLDMFPFGLITTQIEEARDHLGDEVLAHRLEHGRYVVLNRGMNLLQALDAVFSLARNDLLRDVRAACERYGHTPAQIEVQLIESETPLYAYRPHQLLAQRNMMLMNRLDIDVLSQSADQPGERTRNVRPANEPLPPYADHVINGYLPLLAPFYNNHLQQVRFTDRAERDRQMPM